MIEDLKRVGAAMRRCLDTAIRRGEDPLADLWSNAMEMVEHARRLAVKAGAAALEYELVATDHQQDIAAPDEENSALQHKPEYKAARIARHRWFYFQRRTGFRDHVITPYGVIQVLPSDTCPDDHIEWMA